MTTMRRSTDDNSLSVSRTETVRARRKQQETRKLWTGARAVSLNRAAADKTVPNWKRQTATSRGMTTRRFNAAAPALRGGLRALPFALPHFDVSWRWASMALVMVLSAVLFHLFSSPRYFINSINLSGVQYIHGEEIYEASGVDNLNIFWVNADEIQKNVEAIPGIKSVELEVRWPNQVFIAISENTPVLAWSQGGQTMWVDQEGVIFPARAELPELLPIVVDDATTVPTPDQRVPAAAIQAAMELKQLRNNIEMLHYDAINGLSYQDGRSWRGYFGVGTGMDVKLKVYETLVENLLSRGIQPSIVNVVDADAPFYRR
jgi:cell division septal protein FtsQ